MQDLTQRNQRALKTIKIFKEEHKSKLPIMEIFKTYEGEGLKIGTPRILVRVGGCPIKCVSCDTPHSFTVKSSMKALTCEEILSEVTFIAFDAFDCNTSTYKIKEVSITGGEPLMYPEMIKSLAILLHAKGFKTSLETSGAIIDNEIFSFFDYVSIDIKTPSSGIVFEKERIDSIFKLKAQHRGVQVKAVFAGASDLLWIEENLKDFICPTSNTAPLILTPNSPFSKTPQPHSTYFDLMQYAINWNKGYNIVVIPQIHKLLDIDTKIV